jgi:phosphatidylglycerol:prolipoprotein diacylglycerol transferase
VIPYLEFPALQLGPFTLQVFGLLAAAGVFLGARLATRAAIRGGLDPKLVIDFIPWGVACGVLGGHLVHLLFYHPEELQDPFRILKVWEGLSSTGGLLGAVAAAIVYFRRARVRLQDYGDAFALGMAPGWGVARIGCFLIHDHPGVITTFPLGVSNWPPLAMKDWPTRATRHDLGLYDALVLFAITGLLYLLANRRLLRGRLLAVLALTYGASRFLLDFLRARDIEYADARYLGLTPAQYVCFGLLAYGAWRLLGTAARPAGSPSGGATEVR